MCLILSGGCVLYFTHAHLLGNGNDAGTLLSALDGLVGKQGTAHKKEFEILAISADAVRLLGGGRITCCKSGKDRTGQSVTLECARLLGYHYGTPRSGVSFHLFEMN
jgi:hypothetical protein